MKKLIILVTAFAALPVGTLRADFIGVDFSFTNAPVVRINEATGASTLVGLSGFDFLNSMAVNSSGVVYSASLTELVTLNTMTGTGTAVAPISLDVRGMAFSPTNVLYAINNGGGPGSVAFPDDLVTINTSTGASTLIGNTGLNGIQDLAFSKAGVLYGWDVGSGSLTTGRGLVTINPMSGVATPVSSNVGTINIQALAFGSNGNLYGAGDNKLSTINPTTGAATLVGTGSYSDIRGIGLMGTAAVPEPSTLILAGLGALGLFSYRMRWRRP